MTTTTVNSRIELSDSLEQIIWKMTDGNPGSVTVLAELLKHGGKIDPQALFGAGGLAHIMNLDSCKIYGADIWILFKMICKQSLTNLCALLRGFQLGVITSEAILGAIENAKKNQGYNIPVEDILAAVREKLPQFTMEDIRF